jgi:3-oxoadipate enol-lactonase
MIAQTLALEHPADVSALIIAACAPTFSDEMRQAIADRGAAALREGIGAVVAPTMERWFSAGYLAQPASQAARRRLASNSVEGWKHAWQAISGVDTLGRLPSIQVPTLCLAGSDDKSAPPGVVQTIADAIPGARMEILPNAAHMFFIEHPRETATAISAFLTSMPAR